MELAEKVDFILRQSDAALDQFFQLRPITDVPREGAEVLYLKGLSPEALYTSYKDLVEVMQWAHRQGLRHWCDIGCGIGRSCFLWTWLFEDAKATGIELVPERLEEARAAARALRTERNFWIEADFAAPALALPEADLFFLYIATGKELDLLLKKLKLRASPAWVAVIESHGDLKPRLQWEAWWLSPSVHRFPLRSARHDPWLQLYRTRPHHPVCELEESWELRSGILPEELELHPSVLGFLLSKSAHRDWELVVQEGEELWTMDGLGLKWHDPLTLQGAHPPRQIRPSQMKVGLRRIGEATPYRQWSQWRRDGVELALPRGSGGLRRLGVIRKIILSDQGLVEFSSGERLRWSELSGLGPCP